MKMCIRDSLDTIQAIDYYRDNPLVQKAVKELAAAMPEMEVLGADANPVSYTHLYRYHQGWQLFLHFDRQG